MSEYQYYEFLAIDRPLDNHQLDELRSLSTRARITPTSFVNTYQWGGLRADPRTLMSRYFDAFCYLTNWGTHRVMIRLPRRLLDLQVAQRYCAGEACTAWAEGEHVIIDLLSQDETGDWDECGEGWLTSIVPARAELATGDLRVLYLAWLRSAQAGELQDEELEPPVPPDLQTPTAPLRSLVDFLRIDPDLLEVAAAASGRSAVSDSSQAALARWVHRLPAAEKDTLLTQVICGDDPHLRVELLRRFHGQHTGTNQADSGHRTVAELLATAETHRLERERIAAEQQARDRARREHEVAIAREVRLLELAGQQEQAWQRVSALIETKKPAEYDQAVALLTDLRAIGERNGHAAAFTQRFTQLRHQHQRKPSLLQRFDRAGL